MAQAIETTAVALIRAQHIGYGPAHQYCQAVIADEAYAQNPSQDVLTNVLGYGLRGQVDADGELIVHPLALDLAAAAVRLAWGIVEYRRTNVAPVGAETDEITYRTTSRDRDLTDAIVGFVAAIENAYAAEIQRAEAH